MLSNGESMTVSTPLTIKCVDWCNSKSTVVKYALEWTMTERFLASCENVEPIKSPAFRFGKHDELEACVVIYPKGDPHSDNDLYVSLYLQLLSGFDVPITAKLAFTMMNICTHTKEMLISNDTCRPGLGWGFKEMYPRRELWEMARLAVTCTINLVEEDFKADTLTADAVANAGQNRLLAGFRELSVTHRFSDVTLKVGDDVLRAHKAVLASQSPVFDALLAGESGDVINIEDVEVEVVKEMLRFCYTGEVEDLEGFAGKLLAASDKYGLEDLKAICADSLSKNLTVDNVSHNFLLADTHQGDQLKIKTSDFIRRNITAVKRTEGWQSLKKNNHILLIEAFIEK